MSKDVLLIGVDAGTYRAIDRLTDKDRLPAISRLLDRGSRGVLQSSTPPWTPTAWTSLTSGKNPGKHGIFDFKTTDQSRLVNGNDVSTRRIWDYLSEAGKRSIVLNVPVTHPAPDIDGVLIPGYLGPEVDEAVAQPAGVVEELRSNIGSYTVYKSGDTLQGDDLCREYCDLMEMRVDAAEYLCTTYEWDFTMVQFQRTDTVFHELPNREHIDSVYEKLDECVGRLVRTTDASNTMLVSDHGMGPLGEWDFRINTWLEEQGYLETAVDGYQPGWDKPEGEVEDEGKGSLPSRAFQFIAEHGLAVQDIERLLNRAGLSGTVQRLVPNQLLDAAVSSGSEKIERAASRAYCPSGPGLGIYCEDGVREELITALRDVRDPDGNRVFEWVEPADSVFDGPMTEPGPDVLVMPREMNYYIGATLTSRAFEESRYAYNHKREGVCITAGEGVEPVKTTLDITDVAPTVLALLDVELDEDFDGEVPRGVFPDLSVPDERKYDPIEEAHIDESYADVESRLEDLGYFS